MLILPTSIGLKAINQGGSLFRGQTKFRDNIPAGISNLSNNPHVGTFVAWNNYISNYLDEGFEIKLSANYNKNSFNITRQVSDTSEPGSGTTSLLTFGTSINGNYIKKLNDNIYYNVSTGMRYTSMNLNDYSENSSDSVSTPLSYQNIRQEDKTIRSTAGLEFHFYDRFKISSSIGAEHDLFHTNSFIQASGTGLTIANTDLDSVYQKTRLIGLFDFEYNFMKSNFLAFNLSSSQPTYSQNRISSASLSYAVQF